MSHAQQSPKIVELPKPPLKPGQVRTVGPDGRTILSTWKAKILFTQHVSFNFWQRVKLLLGYDMDVAVTIFTEHHPGKYAPKFEPTLTILNDKGEVKAVGKLKHGLRPSVVQAPQPVSKPPTKEG